MTLELTRRLARSQPWLDGVADRVQPAVRGLLERSPQVRNVLDGRWLGAPLHPVLTDVPVGAWSAAALLDAVEDGTDGGPSLGDGALAIGVLAALPTAVTGVSDWAHLRGEQRRIGSLHAVLNSGALVLNVLSLALRAGGRRSTGRALSFLAYGLVVTSAHLGGELVYGYGVRVNRTAWEPGGDEWVTLLPSSEINGETLRRVDVDGVPVVIARSAAGELCAISATCSHLGGPLDQGERRGDTVICPWHGSRFDLCTGEVVDAPAVFPQPRYEVRVREGTIELRRAT